VIEVAAETVGRHLRERDVRAALRRLPSGRPELVRRPRRVAEAPDFARWARERWAPAARAS
jgi:hypothetical protein